MTGHAQAAKHRRFRKPTYETLMRLVGTERCGNDLPPTPKSLRYVFTDCNTIRRITLQESVGIEYRVVTAGDDGLELWIGSGDKWDAHMGRAEVAALTRWLIWDWYVKTAWRRPIYFWALRRYVERSRIRRALDGAE